MVAISAIILGIAIGIWADGSDPSRRIRYWYNWYDLIDYFAPSGRVY